ncbi:flagellar hook assembly protein FlgD [Microbacterium sp. NPDC056234]|uniref:flagellar hook assembly protein FlgD n=1 Tax=Microbacterium sp. NPDC056234 TaxID=3345757 RepID=UPI0035D83F0D
MTTVPPISGTVGTPAIPPTATPAPTQTLDADVFMKLLVTQLTNQDPSSPMDTNEMIAQTTQLASMEQLTALTATTTESFALSMRQTAAALIGQEAQYVDADGVTQSGTVSSVSFAGPVPIVTIGDAEIPLDAVSGLALKS